MSSLLRLGHQQKDFLKSVLNFHHLVLLFLSYSFGVQNNDKYIHTLSKFPRKPYPIPDQKSKVYTRFYTKTMRNWYPSGGTYLYLSYQIPLKLFIEAMDKYVNYEDYQGQESM